MTVPADRFRTALRGLAAGVTVVSCVRDDADHAMTATAFTAVSLDPPLVSVCISGRARFSAAIAGAQTWAVSVLRDDGRADAVWLATAGRPLQGQLDRVPHHRAGNGCALLDRAVAWLECRTVDIIAAGDHDIVVGAVTAAHAAHQGHPLVYWQGDYRGLAVAAPPGLRTFDDVDRSDGPGNGMEGDRR